METGSNLFENQEVADTISLDNAIFTAIGANGGLLAAAFRVGTAAADASDRIIYNSSTGALIYDSDGSASGGAVEFAKSAAGLP
jgi:serralysin